MTHRVFNFNPGPAALPLEVIEEVQAELLDYRGSGMSIMESSHRGPEYSAIHAAAQADVAELLGLTDDYKVLFLGGGASSQFYFVPMNLLTGGRKADYIRTGTWAKKAIKEAKLFGDVHVAHDAENPEGKFSYVPTQDQLDLRDDAIGMGLAHYWRLGEGEAGFEIDLGSADLPVDLAAALGDLVVVEDAPLSLE